MILEIITKEVLEKLYIEEQKSCSQISKLYNINAKKVSRYLQKFGIPARPFSTKGIKGWNKGISMRDESKAKLRTFRMGKKHSEETKKKISLWSELRFSVDNGRTLCIDCHRKTDTYGNKSSKNKLTK